MAKKGKKYPGVYAVKGKKGISYGIDYTHPETGERVRGIRKNATSEAEAAELRAIEIADAKRGAINTAYGIKAKAKPVLFEYMVKAYLKWSKENKDSWKTDEYRAKPLVKAFKGKLMSDINPFMGEKYKAARGKLVQKSTVNKELIFGSQVFIKAIEWQKYQGENPFVKVAKFKVKKGKKPGALTPEEVLAIRDEIEHPVKRDMVDFAFHAGWRISEIRKLEWEDVDLESGLAWIVDPKNSRTAEIELSDEAVEVIKRQKKRSPYVFCKLNGDRFKTNLHRVIKSAANKAGVYLPPRKAWHIFRRTWASMMLQNGCDVETLRVLGNWKDHTMPLWYAEAAGKEARKAALNRIPSLDSIKVNGRNMAEIEKVVSIGQWQKYGRN
jgi:integrase